MSTPNTGSRSEPDTLTTAELVQDVTYATRVSRQAAEATVHAVIDTIRSSLAAGGRVELPGLGTFGVRRPGVCLRRGPEAGARQKSVAARAPYFQPGGELAHRLGDDALRRISVGLAWPPP